VTPTSIERHFPVNELSALARVERPDLARPALYMHKWWARRFGKVVPCKACKQQVRLHGDYVLGRRGEEKEYAVLCPVCGVKPKMIGIRMFAAGLFLLLRDHLAVIDTVTIDVEFEGWGGETRGLLLSHIRQKAHDFPKECIIFRYVGKRDRCHTIALATYRGKRKPDKKATGGELLRFC